MADNALAKDASRPQALLYGDVDSPLLTALGQSMTLVPYNGKTEQIEKAQLVILDGDHFSPEALQADQFVSTALRSGLWVLALDVTKDHKQTGLRGILSVATDQPDSAYLVHIGKDQNGSPALDVIEVPTLEKLGLGKGKRGDLDDDIASRIVDNMLRRLSAPRPPLKGSAEPPGLLYVTYYFTQLYPEGPLWPYQYQLWPYVNPEPPNVPQSPSLQTNETLTVYLNNSNNPQGDFQYVVAESDLTAVPKLPNEQFANYQDFYFSAEGDYLELGWFQTRVNTSLTAPSDSADLWTTVATSPQTVNGQHSVTSSVSFQIGYNQAQGGSGNFGYSSSTTRTIQDWKETNDSDGTLAVWRYRSEYPVDADQPDYYCREQTDLYSQYSCYPDTLPNDLSINNLQLHTSAVWKTPTVEDKVATIALQDMHEMVLLYCPQDEISGIWLRCDSPAQVVDQFPHSMNLSIDLGAVVPVPINSITFNPNPAPPGKVTGTVTLAKPVVFDTEILLSSNSQNATVLPSVTVKKGDTSANFQVLTNANGLGNGGSTTATITAFYAQNYQAQLQVQKTGK